MRIAAILAALFVSLSPGVAAGGDNDRNLYVCPNGAAEEGADYDDPCPTSPPNTLPLPGTLPVSYLCERNKRCGLDDFMARNSVCVLMVMEHGQLKLAVADNGALKCENAPTQKGANDIDRPYGIASMAKSLTSILFGLVNIALPEERKVALDDRIVEHLPSLQGLGLERATISDALTMSSGIEWSDDRDEGELRTSAIDNADSSQSETLLQAVGGILDDPDREIREPGRFNYSALDTALVSLVLQSKLSSLPNPLPADHLVAALQRLVWHPLQMDDQFRWKADRTDNVAAWCCAYATPRDLLKIGQGVLEGLLGGQGADVRDWLTQATTLHRPTAGSCRDGAGKMVYRGYGFQWWVFQDGRNPVADPEMGFTALGKGGQFIHIAPRSGVVIVQLSDWRRQPGGWNRTFECESYAMHRALIRYLESHP